jgi:hypothetical protein
VFALPAAIAPTTELLAAALPHFLLASVALLTGCRSRVPLRCSRHFTLEPGDLRCLDR